MPPPGVEPMLSASVWLARLSSRDPSCLAALEQTYGLCGTSLAERLTLLESVLTRFLERFGDKEVRIFRSPGRINLRGMHVDTHGGYLNLMTHQREVVLVAAPSGEDSWVFVNTAPEFDEVSFSAAEAIGESAYRRPWLEYIAHPSVMGKVASRKGSWDNYLRGAALRSLHGVDADGPHGMHAVVGSDLPRGAALSSSHALCVVTLQAALAFNGRALAPRELVLAVRDAEWYTGARTGTSDQAAEILGGPGQVVNVALLAEDFDISGAQRQTFPDELRVLVVNSHTTRNLSGAQLARYTENRFAYSMAMEILRHELRAVGRSEAFVASMDRLSRMTPESLGGCAALYDLLLRVPERIALDNLRQRYDLPYFDTAYEQCFGGVAPDLRPAEIGLRGPLLFGLAESERARLFPQTLSVGNYMHAGFLMNVGHDGDRVIDRDGEPYRCDTGEEALRGLAESGIPIENVPGGYGASSPVLDALVDAALKTGALGACLTGGGIAGSVLALCQAEEEKRLAGALHRFLGSLEYAEIAGWDFPLSPEKLKQAVVTNEAPAGAGEVVLNEEE